LFVFSLLRLADQLTIFLCSGQDYYPSLRHVYVLGVMMDTNTLISERNSLFINNSGTGKNKMNC
jgi:hypothetical protein